MTDFSDFIFLMGAMIVFSLLTLQTNQMFQMNNRLQINGEIEYNGISIAQDQIDQMRWIQSESDFNDYVSTFPDSVPLTIQGTTLYYNVDIAAADISIPGSNVENKRVTVSVTNDFLKNSANNSSNDRSVQLEFIKSFNTN